MRKFIDCINDNSKELTQCIFDSGDVIFSGIGTYFIEITVSFIAFIFLLLFFKRKKSVVDKSTNITQGGVCNKMNIKFWNK